MAAAARTRDATPTARRSSFSSCYRVSYARLAVYVRITRVCTCVLRGTRARALARVPRRVIMDRLRGRAGVAAIVRISCLSTSASTAIRPFVHSAVVPIGVYFEFHIARATRFARHYGYLAVRAECQLH